MTKEQKEQQKKTQEQISRGFNDKANPFNYGFIIDNYNNRKKAVKNK